MLLRYGEIRGKIGMRRRGRRAAAAVAITLAVCRMAAICGAAVLFLLKRRCFPAEIILLPQDAGHRTVMSR